MKNFEPGQLICCVNDRPCKDCGSHPPLFKGRIYTVTAAFIDETAPCVMLEGLTGVWGNNHSIHDGYESARFKAAEPQKIDVFKEMLEPAKIEKTKREPEPVK